MKHLFPLSLSLLLSFVVNAQIEDTLRVIIEEKDSISTFERIEIPELPGNVVIRETLMQAELFSICESNGFDQLERDMLFLYSAIYPFEEYKNKMFSDHSGRKFNDVFPEEKLSFFLG